MQKINQLLATVLALFISVAALAAQSGKPAAANLTPTPTPVTLLDTPAAAESAEPNLFATTDGRVFLSWIEKRAATRHALRFATLSDDTWSAPRTVAEGDNWFVNWADFPSLIALDEKTLVAHWLVKSGDGAYAYDVNLSRSTDGGKSWGRAIIPHRDGTQSEHGFVSLVPLSQKRVGVVWLDGRKFKAKGKDDHSGHGSADDEMTLRYATLDQAGRLADEAEIDGRTCECCQTSAARTGEGLIVAYRDRSAKEVRDISVARRVGGQWTTPVTIDADNWEIHGCPVNGPSVAADGNNVAVAWFAAPRQQPVVKVVFSKDAGATFGQALRVDDGNPVGRVEILLLADGSAVVVWLEKTDKGAEVRARRLYANGVRGKAITIAESNAARASGFPQVARSKDRLVFAWTDVAAKRVRVATVKVKDF